MMTFRDFLPKEYSKTKVLEVFNCYTLFPNEDSFDSLQINLDNHKVYLDKDICIREAVIAKINSLDKNNYSEMSEVSKEMTKCVIVLTKIKVNIDRDSEVLLVEKLDAVLEENTSFNITLKDRINNMGLEEYAITNIDIGYDSNTDSATINEIDTVLIS